MPGKSLRRNDIERRVCVSRYESAVSTIGAIFPGYDLFALTYGQFSLSDIILALIDKIGPSRLEIATWTASVDAIMTLASMMDGGEITSIRLVIDRSFVSRKPKSYEMLKRFFGVESVRYVRTHMKFVTIRNEQWDIAIRTSMNLNYNPRFEFFEISENYELSEFFGAIVDEIFAEIAPGEVRTTTPAFDFDSGAYVRVTGEKMERASLNEPKYTHVFGRD
jgi:hypothetical protein